MSDNLFDDESLTFLILINHESQYSIWPDILATPAGWRRVQGPMSREACMNWLEANWTDLRPNSLREFEGETAS